MKDSLGSTLGDPKKGFRPLDDGLTLSLLTDLCYERWLLYPCLAPRLAGRLQSNGLYHSFQNNLTGDLLDDAYER